MAKKERLYITAIAINKGIITLIEDNGEIGYYRQRGIQRINPSIRALLINKGFLSPKWHTFPELPNHYSISFEEPDIMGRAIAAFPNPSKLLQGITR